MIAILRTNTAANGVTNVIPILGSTTNALLPTNAIDLAIMVDVYHALAYPYEVLASITRALKPGGRLVFVEYRAEDAFVPIKTLHKMTEVQVRREAAAFPLRWERTVRTLPWQHVVVFRRE